MRVMLITAACLCALAASARAQENESSLDELSARLQNGEVEERRGRGI